MIPDRETNKLYLSPLLKSWYPSFYKNLKKAIDQAKIEPKFLKETKDVWCVDYMPVQISKNKFVQFKFDPKYHRKKKDQKYKTDPSEVCKYLNKRINSSKLIVDGGNVVKWNNKVIMTTRVLEENSNYSTSEIQDQIRESLGLDELILIPQQPDDFTGHADGMVRFLNDETVIINDYSEESDREFVWSLKETLIKVGLEFIEIPTSMYQNKNLNDATGVYINYLQMAGVVFLPIFNRSEDERVFRLFESLFPESKILPVESTELAVDGGVLNCMSWNIMA